MASDINQVTIEGNITRDVELRLAGATSVVQLGVAVNSSRKVDGEWVDEPNFFDVTIFGQLAEHVDETFTKGNRILIQGRLQQRSWETDEGEKRSKVEIVANAVAPSLRFATATINKVERQDG